MIKLKKFGMNENEILEYEKNLGETLSKNIKKLYLRMNDFVKLNEADIKKLENFIGYKIHNDYKIFLQRNNGGFPNKQCFNEDKVINFFLGFFPNIRSEYSIEYFMLSFRGRYPDGMLPIASAGAGDIILIGVANDFFGKIFYWDYSKENFIDQQLKEHSNVSLVSQNLNDLLTMLY